jgi:quinol-cytochrome oxidoreductase complex cytochrome b subunit
VNKRNFKFWTVIYIAIIVSWGIAGYYAYISDCGTCFARTYIIGAVVLIVAFIVMVVTDYISRRKELKIIKEAYKEGS